MDLATRRADRFDSTLFARCPEKLRASVEEAARQHMTLSSNYIREAVLMRLRRDGFRFLPQEQSE